MASRVIEQPWYVEARRSLLIETVGVAAMSALPLTTAQRSVLSLLANDGSFRLPPSDAHDEWMAIWHACPGNLHGLLASRINSLRVDVPPNLREHVDASLRVNTMATLHQRSVVRRMLKLFHEHDIDVVVLKGMALAYAAYPNPVWRRMGDIDVWVGAGQLERAVKALLDNGFRYPKSLPDGVHWPQQPERSVEAPGIAGHVEVVEIVRSFEGLPLDFADRVRQRCRMIDLEGVTMRVLSPRDQLIHLVMNCGAKDRYLEKLVALVDLKMCLERWAGEWRWPEMVEDYRRLGIYSWMALTLRLCHEMLGADLPEDAMRLDDIDGGVEVLQLAAEQLWEVDAQLPPFINDLLTDRSGVGLFRRCYMRLVEHYVYRGPDEPRGVVAGVRRFATRAWRDATVKVPQYVRSWRTGPLRGRERKRRTELAMRRRRLAERLRDAS